MDGLWVTVESTLISLCFAAVLGLIFGLMSVSRNTVLRGIARVYVDIIRGTPLIVQAFFIYFGITSALNIRMEAIVAGIITLTLNAGAYSAEPSAPASSRFPRARWKRRAAWACPIRWPCARSSCPRRCGP